MSPQHEKPWHILFLSGSGGVENITEVRIPQLTERLAPFSSPSSAFEFERERSVKPERFNEYVDGIGRYLAPPIFIIGQTERSGQQRPFVIPQINSSVLPPPRSRYRITYYILDAILCSRGRKSCGKRCSFIFICRCLTGGGSSAESFF